MFLELKNTHIGYKTALIEDVETGLQPGEICLIIGNNGVGKTTLIKSILNQIPVLRGDIFVHGKNIKALSHKEIAEQVAVVFSKAQTPANYTVEDLISLGKYIHYPFYFELNLSDKQEVEQIISDLNLTQYRNLLLAKLSDGNLQKAFIGRALAQNSPIIILDEPTTHLDEENKIIILKLLRHLAKEHNKLILFSSHDWRLAKEFADKIWLISQEKLDAGIAEEVLLKHQEILDPKLFQLDENFSPPQISAPFLQKELLVSFLQKNFKKKLSEYNFEYQDSFWVISVNNIQQKAENFTEIAQFLQNYH